MSFDACVVFDRPLDTTHGRWQEYLIRVGTKEIVVLCHGEWREVDRPLVRLHSSCLSAHYLASTECDCREQLDIAYRTMCDAGAGVVFHLEQDGRGNGHLAIMRAAVRARADQSTQGAAYAALGYPEDARTYGEAVAAAVALGLRKIALMTNNPDKLRAFTEADIDAEMVSIVAPGSAFDAYYSLKAREGHRTSRQEPDP